MYRKILNIFNLFLMSLKKIISNISFFIIIYIYKIIF